MEIALSARIQTWSGTNHHGSGYALLERARQGESDGGRQLQLFRGAILVMGRLVNASAGFGFGR